MTKCFTNDCIFYRTKTLDNQEVAIIWDIPLDLEETNYKYVRISEFFILPLKTRQLSGHKVYLNIIKRTLGNPFQQIGCIIANPMTRFTLQNSGN